MAFTVAVTTLALAPRPRAGEKTTALLDQLKKSPDHRVRAQAALALGTSDDVEALKPLCKCLKDLGEVDSVRVACAAALGKLRKPGAEQCLKENEKDSSAKVRSSIQESLKSIGASAPVATSATACAKPAAKAKPKALVGLSIANKTTRADGDVKPIVEREMKCALLSSPGYSLALGDDTTPKKMAAAVAKDKVSGYFLSVSIEPFKYDGSGLKVSLRAVIMTHTRDLKGEITKSLSMPSVKTASKQKEETLLAAATQRLVEDFVATAQ